MKTFEEKFTAWIDGELSAEEAWSFQNDHPSLEKERAELLKLKDLLKQGLEPRVLEHPDFFNAQIMAQIERERPRRRDSLTKGWLGLPRLAWGGICALAIGFAMFVVLIPHGDLSDPRSGYVADVLKTKTRDPNVKATVDNQKDMTIIKLEGLQKLPPDKNLNP
jgi:anti-sigma factor RsiW